MPSKSEPAAAELPRHPPLAKRVLLVGWDGADWQIINPLLDAGKLPTLERFLNAGVMGNIATLRPMLSPILWTSIATGKRPSKHGIYGFVEPRQEGDDVQTVLSTSRQTKAIWNILSQNGLRSQVFGWFASHPAEPLPGGVCVTNAFAPITGPLNKPSPLLKDCIYPERLRESIGPLRIHPDEMEGDHLTPFLPRGSEIDQSDPVQQERITLIRRILSQCAGVHAAATWALEHEPWDFAAIYYDGIDVFGHGFMSFHPPKMEAIDAHNFEMYREVVTGIYRFHDLMLARLLELAGDETTVILVSDHGFYSDHLRPPIVPDAPPNPVAWHRPHGIIALRGSGILADERVYGSTLLDIAPTILTLFGLPIGDDMDGRALAQVFEQPPIVGRIPSWDLVDGPHSAGLHPLEKRLDPVASSEALQQLIDLGYVAPLPADKQLAIEQTKAEQRFNLAVSHLDAEQPREAVALLEKLYVQNPDETRYGLCLAQAQLGDGQLADARRVLEAMLAKPEKKTEPLALPQTDLLLGILLAAEGRDEESLEHLRRAEKADPHLPRLHNQIGLVYNRRRLWAEAERAFTRALEIDSDDPTACHGLSVCLLRLDRPEEAAEFSLRAVGLQHFFPGAHFQLGAVLARLNWPERAAQAFEMGLQMRPGVLAAHRYLARIYGRLGLTEKARFHREAALPKQTAAVQK